MILPTPSHPLPHTSTLSLSPSLSFPPSLTLTHHPITLSLPVIWIDLLKMPPYDPPKTPPGKYSPYTIIEPT